jgi:hypothetical protein
MQAGIAYICLKQPSPDLFLFRLHGQVEGGLVRARFGVVLGDQAGVAAHVHQDVDVAWTARIGRWKRGLKVVVPLAVGDDGRPVGVSVFSVLAGLPELDARAGNRPAVGRRADGALKDIAGADFVTYRGILAVEGGRSRPGGWGCISRLPLQSMTVRPGGRL